MNVELLARATGMVPELAARWIDPITEAAKKFELDANPKRLAMWLAQCGEESMRFTVLRENLNYRAAALRAVWPKRFPTDVIAAQYEHKPEAIANHVYGGRNGNGPEESGDGWLFRGRGLIEVTFRTNYRNCGKALGVDLELHPELLESDKFAALSAGWYWKARELYAPSDAGDVKRCTELVNGGHLGLDVRAALYVKALEALS